VSVPGITGKVAVVTGAARGIGREYARALAGVGAAVACSDVLDEAGQETVELITKEGGKAVYVRGDVNDEASMNAMADEVVAQLGSLDILVNNAGIWGGLEFQTPLEISRELWDKVVGVNVTGSWLAAKACAAKMIESGGGVIVNQSSIGSYLGGPLLAHYCTSKAAVNGLTKALARDLGEENIRVNAIAPGIITTEATMSNVGDELLDALEATQAIKRRGTPEDLVGPLLFLCGDASAFMTGQVLVVDGGGILLG
jgi:NAD(P)-dependent dehydrogenase (short-subunit alcohol dehydrogenase family)